MKRVIGKIASGFPGLPPEDQMLTVAQLAPLDQFHTRSGAAASVSEVQTNLITISSDDVVKGRYKNEEAMTALEAT